MYFCVGTFLTTLKICKASSTKQKELGAAIFKAIQPKFDWGDDDSAISAVFRGRRNLNSLLQLEFDDIDPKALSFRFADLVLPLLDENKMAFAVRLLQTIIKEDEIGENTHVELVNKIKKKNLVEMNEVVLEDFLAGIFLYAIRFTDNLNKERAVKDLNLYLEDFDFEYVSFIPQYHDSPYFDDDIIRPSLTLYKQGGATIDVVYADLFEINKKSPVPSKTNVVIPVNTSFETKLECNLGEEVIPLVSENTIHGKWIMHLKARGLTITDIDKEIALSLQRNHFTKCGVRNTKVGKQDVYPIASVAKIVIENSSYFLLALSEFDDRNKAKSSVSNIKKAINNVIDYYDTDGQGFDLYIPLIGSGRSRSGLSPQESYDLLKETLIHRKSDIFGKIHIVVHPDQVDQIDIKR